MADLAVIRKLAKSILDRPRTERTREANRAKADRVLRNGTLEAYARINQLGDGSWYVYKAAVQQRLSELILLRLKEYDRARRNGDKKLARQYRTEAETVGAYLASLAPSYDNTGPRLESVHRPTTKMRKKSKRQSLRGLPETWREDIFQELDPKFRLYWLIQSATGCRSAELGGIVIAQLSSIGLVATIRGAKTQQGHGQAWRRLTLDFTVMRGLLAREIEKAGGTLTVDASPPEGAYREAVRRAAGRAFGGRTDITPYCARHQWSADLKASGFSKAEIAQAMGHCSTRTQQVYGMRSQGRGGFLLAVEAARLPHAYEQARRVLGFVQEEVQIDMPR